MSLDIELLDENCNVLFESNITHNLTRMAEAARIYIELWRPEDLHIMHAEDLIYPLKQAIRDLEARPEYYKRYDASNGWGKYRQFLSWLKDYWKACVRHPDAVIDVDR